MQNIVEFIVSSSQQREYVIDQLISKDSGYGIIAARTGLGKTNLTLNLALCLANGMDFLGLTTKRSKVAYFAFEGGEDNLKDRCLKIITRTPTPQDDWLQI